MSETVGRLARAPALRSGEGRSFAALGAYLLVCGATGVILVATMNGLFLSVYPGRLIPHVIIASAIVTATAAVLFTAAVAGTARRRLAVGLTAILVLTLAACRWAVGLDPRSAFAVYLAVSTVQVLLFAHAWSLVGDVLEGRQAKRLVPLIGIFTSVGAIVGGSAVPAAATRLGTVNLLLVGGGLVLVALPLIWLVPEPGMRRDDAAAGDAGAVKAFARRAGRGFRSVRREPLLRLLAVGTLAIGATGTLIELEFKLALQASYQGDRITAILGVLGAITGAGTLIAQLFASRLIFPRLGVSFAAKLHGGIETLAVGLAAIVPGVWFLAGALATDDILRNPVQKGWEQASLVPFPRPVKSAAVATLDGVIQPLARVAGGAVAILLVSRLSLVSAIMTGSAALAFVLFLRHRRLYVAALTRALTRHTIDFSPTSEAPLVVDQDARAVIDRSLVDEDPTVVVFATSLVEQLPPQDAAPRLVTLLSHAVPEVRAEACHVVGRMELEDEPGIREVMLDRLSREQEPFVLTTLLEAMSGWREIDAATVEPFLEHADREVGRQALVTLGRWGWPHTRRRIRALLASERGEDRAMAAKAVGALRLVDLVDDLASVVRDAEARPAVLEALAHLGPPAVPVLVGVLERRQVPLPARRSAVTALASMQDDGARRALLELVEEPALGPAALTSLHRLRREGRMLPVDPGILRGRLETEIRGGFRYAAVASAVVATGNGTHAFISRETEGLCGRAVSRVSSILALSHDPVAVEAARTGLTSDDIGGRANALELLQSALSPEEASLVLPFAEGLVEGFPMERVRLRLREADSIAAAPLEALAGDDDWWPNALALHGLGRDNEISIPGRDPGPREDSTMIPLIERVMILRGSELFRQFPGSDLAGIASLVEMVYLDAGDILFEQGDPGDAFYMVVRGAVRISRGSHDLAVLGPREGLGEMAILDRETRSTTATAAEPTTLMKIDRDSFDRLVEQNPSVARGIYRVLTRRLRDTPAKSAAG